MIFHPIGLVGVPDPIDQLIGNVRDKGACETIACRLGAGQRLSSVTDLGRQILFAGTHGPIPGPLVGPVRPLALAATVASDLPPQG